MIPLTPSFLLATLTALAADGADADGTPRLTEVQPIHDVLDPATARALCEGDPPEIEDVAFLSRLGFCTHWDHEAALSTWPLPLTPTKRDLAALARELGILAMEPMAGDFFLGWSFSRGAFEVAGVVAAVRAPRRGLRGHGVYECQTFEATRVVSPNCAFSAHGGEGNNNWRVVKAERRLVPAAGDRCVRWVDLDWRATQYDATLGSNPLPSRFRLPHPKSNKDVA